MSNPEIPDTTMKMIAMKTLKCSYRTLETLIAEGRIGVVEIPHGRTHIVLADIRRLLSESTRPAVLVG